EDRIIKGMIGRELKDRFPKRDTKIGDVCFEVKNWKVFDPNNESREIIKSVNFNLRRGEIVGFAGLMGSGRTEIAMSVFGKSYGIKIEGQIFKDGKEVKFNTVSDAINNGVAYVSEDRKTYGLVLINDIKTNTTLPNLSKISDHSIVDSNKEIHEAESYRKKLNIKSSSISQLTGNLSGGNQQKVVLSKWIMADPDVLILDEPTRGIDVGAKYEIYQIMNDLVSQGKSIIMISSEMPEVLGMSDRVYVINNGKIAGELEKRDASPEKIMKCILSSN
ncbi:MAG: ATP-binding cassette domain-containing protein, partial [Oscillospiraceae bacterium]|nr:ATP-binding cassette domain-containing protein [Oscillospiraceae bacterium]